MDKRGGDKPSNKRERLNVYLRRRGTLQVLRILAILESEKEEKKVRVNDLVNDALEAYVRQRLDVRNPEGFDPEQIWKFFDVMEIRGWQEIRPESSGSSDSEEGEAGG
jgi:hypothetical protein